MKSYTKEQIQKIFQDLNLTDNQTLLIHSALQNFGLLHCCEIAKIPQIWISTLLDLSAKHNLIIPTFNYDFPKSHLEDLRFQQSKIGILNEEFRKITTFRSTHPMFNFCGFGKNVEKIIQPATLETNPFLQESLYHRLFWENALMLFLGIDLRVCTFMVYVEAMCGVKYRFFKPFSGEVITHKGQKFQGEFYHFCLPQSERLKVSYGRIQQELMGAGILRFFPLGASGIYAFRAKEFFHFVQNRLKQEPFILLENPPKTYYQWIDNREQIIGGGGAKQHKILFCSSARSCSVREVVFKQILVLGTGTLALNIAKKLKEICTNFHAKLLCASYLESPFSLFSTWCKSAKIPYTNFCEKVALEDYLAMFDAPTLIISAHNYYLFPLAILQNPLLKIVNYHNSLLPRHRGLNAQMWSIFEQDSQSGITWHCVSNRIDCGEIILQKSIPLDSTYTYLKLTQKQLQLGFNAFVEICDSLMQWNPPLKTQEKSSNSVLHKAQDLPNNGILDLYWNFEKKSAFLRSMDCGKSHLLPKPKIILKGKTMEILSYAPNPKTEFGFDFILGE